MAEITITEEQAEAQVVRILNSNAFRNSRSLCRLLKFLWEKSRSGEADGLKEYSIGLDAFGKPPSYDPRKDSIVRVQVKRLRKKLSEYYRSEGADDLIGAYLPNGGFKLGFRLRRVPDISLCDSGDMNAEIGATLLPVEVSNPQEVHRLREENARLKKLVADLFNDERRHSVSRKDKPDPIN
jgi:hypothetical protein